MITQLEFEQMCRDASLRLGLADTWALGEGFTTEFADVLFETTFREGRKSFLLMAEIGHVPPQDRGSVFEALLTIQLVTWDRPALRFGFNPKRGTVVLCLEAMFGPHCNSAWLATLIQSIGKQVIDWRTTLLDAAAADNRDGMGEAAFSDFLAQRR